MIRATSDSGQSAVAVQPLPETLPGDVIHHVVEQPGRLARGVHRDDAGVPEPRDHPRFGEESLGDGTVNREVGVDHLHRHRTIQRGVAGEEDDAHAAVPQFPLKAVLGPEGRLQAGTHQTGHGAASDGSARRLRQSRAPMLGPDCNRPVRWIVRRTPPIIDAFCPLKVAACYAADGST